MICTNSECRETIVILNLSRSGDELLILLGLPRGRDHKLSRLGSRVFQYLIDIEETHDHYSTCYPRYESKPNVVLNKEELTIYCCGQERDMSKRQQLNRERFFADNQARKPTLITIEGEEFLETESAYNTGFVAAIKAKIPSKDRYWDKTTRRWGVRARWRAVIVEILLNTYGGHLEERTEAPSLASKISRDTDKLATEAVSKARTRLIKARGADRLVI